MIALERELAQDWQGLFYPRGPELPEGEQIAQAPVTGPGGAAFGITPAMKSAASRTGQISPAGRMLPADVAAGALKGTVTGGVGLAGDIESLVRGIRGIFTRGGDQGKLDAFLSGLEEKTILPTSEDVNKWLDKNVGPVVPPGAPMAEQRAGVAEAGQLAGELTSGPGALIKGAKAGARAAGATAKFVAPKAGEMLSSYMRRSGMTPELMAYHGTPHTFAPEPGAPMGRFRAEKIGSGEGVQAYGRGLYFAESPEVAGSYRTTLSSRTKDRLKVDGKVVDPDTLFGRAVEDIPRIGLQATLQKIDDNIRFNSKYAPNIADLYRSVRQQVENLDPSSVTLDKGSLYTVYIPDEMVDKMLDWNKPLTQQPKRVQQKLQTLVDSQFGKGTWSSWSQNDPDYKDLANDLFSGKSAAEVSELLRQSGIPGLRYFDQGSRAGGEGTRNIVVFPGGEDQVKIIKVE